MSDRAIAEAQRDAWFGSARAPGSAPDQAPDRDPEE
jgi:hypothetical protein